MPVSHAASIAFYAAQTRFCRCFHLQTLFVAANLFATFAVYCELIANATKHALYYLRPSAQTQLQMHLHRMCVVWCV